MTSSEIAVRARGLGKRYMIYEGRAARLRELFSPTRRRYGREFWALRGVDLAIERGCVYGLIGRNGAGKSTMLKVLAGRLLPTVGEFEVRGRIGGILELGTGLNPNLTGRQNARVNALFLGLDPWQIESQLERIIEFAELGEFVDQPLQYYSTGMRARLAISVLTALRSDVLVLDEALATGDAQFSAKCRTFMRGLCSSGCTTMLVSHDLTFMLETCHRIGWLDGGTLRADGEPPAVVAQYLEQLGQAHDLSLRPKHLLLRLEVEGEADPVEHRLHSLGWLDAAGGAIAGRLPLGDGGTMSTCFELASVVGLTERGARAGWGATEAHPERGSLRRVSPGEGGAFLALAVPPPPAPIPERVSLAGVPAARPLRLSAFADGRFVPLGSWGTSAGEWTEATFQVGELLRG